MRKGPAAIALQAICVHLPWEHMCLDCSDIRINSRAREAVDSGCGHGPWHRMSLVSPPQVREGVWDIYQEVPEDYVNGYAYAIATGSATILSYYQQRCLANVERKAAVHLQQEKQLHGGAAAAAAASAGQGVLGGIVSRLRGLYLDRWRGQQEKQQQQQQQGLGGAAERDVVDLEQGGLRGAAVEGAGAGGSGNWGLGAWGSAAGRRGGAGAAALGKKAADQCTFHIDYS